MDQKFKKNKLAKWTPLPPPPLRIKLDFHPVGLGLSVFLILTLAATNIEKKRLKQTLFLS